MRGKVVISVIILALLWPIVGWSEPGHATPPRGCHVEMTLELAGNSIPVAKVAGGPELACTTKGGAFTARVSLDVVAAYSFNHQKLHGGAGAFASMEWRLGKSMVWLGVAGTASKLLDVPPIGVHGGPVLRLTPSMKRPPIGFIVFVGKEFVLDHSAGHHHLPPLVVEGAMQISL